MRSTIDALQVEVNQLRSEIVDCQDSRVPAELSPQECSSRAGSFQQWTLQEVVEGRNRDAELTGHVKTAIDELRV